MEKAPGKAFSDNKNCVCCLLSIVAMSLYGNLTRDWSSIGARRTRTHSVRYAEETKVKS
jgi:hypothetical protein